MFYFKLSYVSMCWKVMNDIKTQQRQYVRNLQKNSNIFSNIKSHTKYMFSLNIRLRKSQNNLKEIWCNYVCIIFIKSCVYVLKYVKIQVVTLAFEFGRNLLYRHALKKPNMHSWSKRNKPRKKLNPYNKLWEWQFLYMIIIQSCWRFEIYYKLG